MNIPKLDTAAVGYPVTRLGVSFFPVYLRENELPEIATGDSSGLVVDELDEATVPTLSANNPTDKPILVVEGEHFIGGKQNRAVNATVLVPPMTKLEIPVSCLERERWGRRRAYRRSASYAPQTVRSRVQETVNASMRDGNSRTGDQGAVWEEVDNLLTRSEVASETAAAEDVERARRRDSSKSGAVRELAGLGPLPGQNGIVVTHGRWVTSVDLFGSANLLAVHWSALVRSHLLEVPGKTAVHSANSALWAIRRFGSMPSESSPGVGLGTEQRVTDHVMVGQALTLDGMIAHASAFMMT